MSAVFPIVTPVRVLNPVLLDDKEGPYIHATEAGAIALANAGVPIGVRQQGQSAVLIISGVSKRYHWQNGNADTDLVPLTTPLPQALGVTDNPTFGDTTVASIAVTGPNATKLRKTIGGGAESALIVESLCNANQAGVNVLNVSAINNTDGATVKIAFRVTSRATGAGNADIFIDIASGGTLATTDQINAHAGRTDNPHTTTLEQARAAGNAVAGDINMAGHRLINIPDAVNPNDPVSKQQFDTYNNSVGGDRAGIDCSTNPNYPAALKGDRFEVLQPGKIGGSAGVAVDTYNEIVCATPSAAGNHAAVGANFYIVRGNMQRATTSTSGYVQLATSAEAIAGTETNNPVTPATALALVLDQRKTYKKSISVSRGTPFMNEAVVYFDAASIISSIVGSQVTNIMVKTTVGGTYTTVASMLPLAMGSASSLFIQFDFSSSTFLNGAITINGKDN